MGNRKYFFLYPFSLVFRLITDVRNFLYNTGLLKSEKFNIPVICVGNLTVGGTGKTPHTEYLVRLLKDKFRIAVLSRGYKRKSPGFRIANEHSSIGDIGDEPLQIFRKFPGITVAVDKNRVNGIHSILNSYPDTNVIILDDGFQHRKINPGLSILLTDYNRLISRDYLLPYGRLRESRKNIWRANIIIVTKSPENISDEVMENIAKEIRISSSQRLFFTSVVFHDPLPVFQSTRYRKLNIQDEFTDERAALLITGIADPIPLVRYLNKYFPRIKHLEFPDHHWFNQKDIEKIIKSWDELKSAEKYIITTEKDAIRLKDFANIDPLKEVFYYIPVEIKFLNNSGSGFDNLITDYAGTNKRNN